MKIKFSLLLLICKNVNDVSLMNTDDNIQDF